MKYINECKRHAEEIHPTSILPFLLHRCWFLLVHSLCVLKPGEKKNVPGIKNCSMWWQTTVMESISLNRLTSTARKKKKKTELKGKWVIFKPLKTEPQRAAEPRGAKRHQRPSAKRPFQVTFSFLCLLGLHDSQHEVVKLSPDCQPHSSQLHANVITEISNIRFQLPCWNQRSPWQRIDLCIQ